MDLAQGQPDLRLIVLFGSVASGTSRADSDVDLAVLGLSSWDGLKLGSELARGLDREPHVIELKTATVMLRYEVARTGVLLFEAEPRKR